MTYTLYKGLCIGGFYDGHIKTETSPTIRYIKEIRFNMVDTSPDAPVQTSPIELYRHAKVGNCQFWLHETVTEEDALKKLTHMITEENFWCIADGRAARRERNINEVYGSLK